MAKCFWPLALGSWLLADGAAAQEFVVPLHEGWSFQQVGKEQWHPAEVPGTVHDDLLRNGSIPAPMRNANIDSVQWVENEDWIYRRTFTVNDSLTEKPNIDLVFKGLDTFAEVYLNDSLLGKANNMFRQWEWPVKQLLRPGANELKVIFRSTIKEGAKLRDAYGIQLPHDNEPSGVNPYVRKAAYQFGWDFAPRLVLGVTWITWLEQGRPVNASVPALCRLAEALQLTPAERMSLFDLAGKRDPVANHTLKTDMPADLLSLPTQVSAPAYLLDASYAAIAWNDQAGELFVGWLDTGAEQPNLLEFVFLSERARDLLVDWPERARRLVAEFRADFNRDPGDVRLKALAESLAERSADFERIWRSQDVLNRDGGVRTFSHPERGESQFFQTTFHLASHAGVKLVCLLPLCRDADQGIGDASDQA